MACDPPAVSELSRLLGISRAYKASKVLNLAAKLDVFTLVHKTDGLTWKEIAKRLDLQSGDEFRGAVDFLDLLVSINCLDRIGDGPNARYVTHPSTARFLVRGSPDYMGGILILNNDRSSVLFSYLEDALRTGEVPPEAHQRVPDIITTFARDEGAAEHFANGMLGASRGNFRMLADKFDFSRYQTFADVGGSTGCCCVAVCERHPHITASTCDLPAVRKVAQSYVDGAGMAARVKVVDLDFFSDDPFPAHDAILMGMILHDWGVEKKKLLMKKTLDALPPGGAFIAVDTLIDDERRTCTSALGMSLNMLVEFGKENSFDYSFKEFTEWALDVGYSRTEVIPLVGASAAAIAYK